MSTDRLESSLDIDRMTPLEIVRVMNREDQHVTAAVAVQERRLAHAIDSIADRLRHGGRLFYVGAGTSGRIAMLDAAEIPPTFGTDPSLVQVIMAGGEEAFFRAVEGAEDDGDAAIDEVGRRVRESDAVAGIAASGSTPFTVAAVKRANILGALTIAVTSVRDSPLARECDIPIVVETGPEVIMGSTRLKSGTAQKLILNTISTGVMIQLGHVYSNLMVDMPATNAKLRRRAVEMVRLAAGVASRTAEKALQESGGDVRVAVVMARKGVSRSEAETLLAMHGGNLREVIGD